MILFLLASIKDNNLVLAFGVFFLVVFSLEIRARLSNTCDQSENV